MTEKKKRKKIAKLAVKLYLAEIAGGESGLYKDWIEVAERILNENEKYINEASEPEPSTEQVEPETEQIEPETDSPDLSWARWVATDMTGDVYAYESRPYKVEDHWLWEDNDKYIEITPNQAITLCGRLPKWEDEEPTPVKK